jgi:hypothetical protein
VSRLLDQLLTRNRDADLEREEAIAEREARCHRILSGCTPHQRRFILDPAQYKSLRCPRRAGKSFAMSAHSLYTGEHRPGARILVVSLTMKSTKENYWTGPAGLGALNYRFKLGLKMTNNDLVWTHPNGSRGRLAGAETRADMEYLRGAAAEADVVFLDETKSFAPGLLIELIQDILEPGLMTRDGVIVMGGTPGLIPVGPFYEATAESSRVTVDVGGEKLSFPTCLRYDPEKPPAALSFVNEDGEEEAVNEPWSLHSWTIKESALPGQWKRALRIKRRARWGDDHPSWRREYLGEWVQDSQGLVYKYAEAKDKGAEVTWTPNYAHGRAGLDPTEGPWHLVFGLDLGFNDETALVVAAYSDRLGVLRHVWDFKEGHLLPPQVLQLLEETIERFGHPTAVVADTQGGASKMVSEWFTSMGIPIEAAKKSEKNTHIEMVNGDFLAGRIQLIPGGNLENEICGLQWDLSKGSYEDMVREGKLREDKRLPNHLCDALLYLWRFSYHQFSRADGPESLQSGTVAWLEAREREIEQRLAGQSGARRYTTDGYPGTNRPALNLRDEAKWQAAFRSLRN